MGATGQVATLLDRDPAACSSLDSSGDVASLLEQLRKAGARAQAAELIERLPAAGLFQLFREQEGCGQKFRFGRLSIAADDPGQRAAVSQFSATTPGTDQFE